jgi:PTH1 family peptidyl-tRNA hydrolase
MILIVGLGNPGKKYANTWHNMGFLVIDKFKEMNNLPGFKLSKKINSLVSENILDGEKIILAKPQTFMNESGKAVKAIFSCFQRDSINQFLNKNLIIVHDDIDFPLGKIRISKNRGSAGHKGIQSIIQGLKTKNFVRFRVGICPQNGKPEDPEQFVLQKFRKEKEKIIKKTIKKTAEAIKFTLENGLEKAMNKYNQ